MLLFEVCAIRIEGILARIHFSIFGFTVCLTRKNLRRAQAPPATRLETWSSPDSATCKSASLEPAPISGLRAAPPAFQSPPATGLRASRDPKLKYGSYASESWSNTFCN